MITWNGIRFAFLYLNKSLISLYGFDLCVMKCYIFFFFNFIELLSIIIFNYIIKIKVIIADFFVVENSRSHFPTPPQYLKLSLFTRFLCVSLNIEFIYLRYYLRPFHVKIYCSNKIIRKKKFIRKVQRRWKKTNQQFDWLLVPAPFRKLFKIHLVLNRYRSF